MVASIESLADVLGVVMYNNAFSYFVQQDLPLPQPAGFTYFVMAAVLLPMSAGFLWVWHRGMFFPVTFGEWQETEMGLSN